MPRPASPAPLPPFPRSALCLAGLQGQGALFPTPAPAAWPPRASASPSLRDPRGSRAGAGRDVDLKVLLEPVVAGAHAPATRECWARPMGQGWAVGRRCVQWSEGPVVQRELPSGAHSAPGGLGGQTWGQEVSPEPLWERAHCTSRGWPPSAPPAAAGRAAGCTGLRRAGLLREAVPAAATGRVGMRIAGVQLGGHRDTWGQPATGPLRQRR